MVFKIANIMEFLATHLTEEELEHCIKVGKYALQDVDFYDISSDDSEFKMKIYCTALFHSIIEKTEISFGTISDLLGSDTVTFAVIDALEVLAQNPNDSYTTYIEKIANSNNKIAIIIKRADLKAHLIEAGNVLTYETKEQYINLVRYLI